MLRHGTLIELDQVTHPGCYLHRSHPNDVARMENLTSQDCWTGRGGSGQRQMARLPIPTRVSQLPPGSA